MTLGPVMLDVAGPALEPADREVIAHPQTGGVILFTRNFEDVPQLLALVAAIHAVKSPQVLVAVDQEGGRVQRLRAPFTALPPVRALGRYFDIDPDAALVLARDCGWLMASELRAVDIDLSFAPVADLDYGVSTVIGDRAFHSDPDSVGALALEYLRGMADAGMAATAKHFPGHGGVAADSHHALPVDRRSAAELKPDLKPFRRLVNAGVKAVMTAHVVYPQVDELPASFSRRWLQEVLRRRYGFEGAIFSDDLSMQGAAGLGDVCARADAALAAGCDMLPVCNDRAAAVRLLEHLSDHVDPVSQLRLLRLHGKGRTDGRQLRASARYRDVVARIADLDRPDPLTLDVV
jgi:beta-N-acetylhexosaminidase